MLLVLPQPQCSDAQPSASSCWKAAVVGDARPAGRDVELKLYLGTQRVERRVQRGNFKPANGHFSFLRPHDVPAQPPELPERPFVRPQGVRFVAGTMQLSGSAFLGHLCSPPAAAARDWKNVMLQQRTATGMAEAACRIVHGSG